MDPPGTMALVTGTPVPETGTAIRACLVAKLSAAAMNVAAAATKMTTMWDVHQTTVVISSTTQLIGWGEGGS